MSDVLCEIINRLPPSTLRLILDLNEDSSNQTSLVSDLLHEFEEIKIRETNRELKRKIIDLESKTAENRKLLLRLQNELEVLKHLKRTTVNMEGAVAYTQKINEFESKLGKLAKNHDDVDLSQLFKDIDELNLQIEDYKKKISEAKSKYQSYEGFPPNITEGKKAIAMIKEKIKHNNSIVNSLYQS